MFLSSIKVNGESTASQPFRADDAPAPQDAYGRSKLGAEQALWQVCGGSRLDGVVVRLPLVHGPGAKANVARLVRLVQRGLPLPFGSIDNRRSLLALGNLCDFVALALEHPRAPGRVWLLSDGDDLSTPQLVRHIAARSASRRGSCRSPWPCCARSARSWVDRPKLSVSWGRCRWTAGRRATNSAGDLR